MSRSSTRYFATKNIAIGPLHHGSGHTITPYLFIYEVMLAAGGKVKLRRNRRKNVRHLNQVLLTFMIQ